MKHFANVITDPTDVEIDSYAVIDRWFAPMCRDKRDLAFIRLTLKITFTLIPLAILLYMPVVQGAWWWMLAAVYLYLNNVVFKGPFGLMLHCTSHRRWFKKQYSYCNHYLPWVIGPFFGQTPETYFSHHIGMHHPENNLPGDKSCTMFYQRDSLRGFIRYFSDFFFIGIFRLSYYFIQKRRLKLLVRSVLGEVLFIAMCVALCFISWQATLIVFILPFLTSRIIMMVGNWSQHAFVEAEDPANAYKNSATCINTAYNRKCWNDGYHANHHVHPAIHWTEHPKYFLQSLNSYAENDAIVFDGIHFLHIFIYLVLKRYDLLAKNFVNINNRFSSDEEIIELLKSRTKRIGHYRVPVRTRAKQLREVNI